MSSNRTTFRPGDPHTVACAKKGKAASPMGQHPLPLSRKAKRTKRLALIQQIARKP